jgi:hypothetical protein
MSSLNAVTLVGHLGRKPELRYTTTQAAYALHQRNVVRQETEAGVHRMASDRDLGRNCGGLRPAPGRWTSTARARAALHSLPNRPPWISALVYGGPG